MKGSMQRNLVVAGVLLSAWVSASAETLFAGDPEVVSQGHRFAEGMAFDGGGNLYFTDVPAGELYRVDGATEERTLVDGQTGNVNGIAMGPDGRLYGCAGGSRRIVAWDLASGVRSMVAEGPHSNDIAICDDGTIYFTDPQERAVWVVSPAPARTLAKARTLDWKPNGIGWDAARKRLLVAAFETDTVFAFPVRSDGSLGESKPAYRLTVDGDGRGFLDGMVVLPSGRLLIGTRMGIQRADPLGGTDSPLSPVVVPPFNGRPRCNYIRLSPDRRWLYAAFKDDILRLRLAPNAAD